LLIAVLSLAMFLFNALMRKLLKVERPKAFSHNHVNDTHKKIDWSIRILFIFLMLIGGFINATRLDEETYLFLETWFLLFVLVFITETIRAVMERKYAKNPNAYLYTVSQMVFATLLVIVVFSTDFFGIF
jgi:hypothetical protein